MCEWNKTVRSELKWGLRLSFCLIGGIASARIPGSHLYDLYSRLDAETQLYVYIVFMEPRVHVESRLLIRCPLAIVIFIVCTV